MGPLRKKGRGAGGGKTEALAPGEELPGISPELDNNKVRPVTMNGRKESITKSSSSASAAFESLNAASRFGLSVRVGNQRKSEPTSSENTPRYSTLLFCTPQTLFLLPMHCMLLPGLGFLSVFYARAQDSRATELECLALSKTLCSFFLSVGWVVVFLPVVLGLSSGTRRNTTMCSTRQSNKFWFPSLMVYCQKINLGQSTAFSIMQNILYLSHK